jgi:ankyrin repeat protein
MVKLLLKYGAEVNVQANNQDSPLHDAAENNHYDVVKLLLNNGADPFVKNAYDRTPLDVCNLPRIRLLLEDAIRNCERVLSVYAECDLCTN